MRNLIAGEANVCWRVTQISLIFVSMKDDEAERSSQGMRERAEVWVWMTNEFQAWSSGPWAQGMSVDVTRRRGTNRKLCVCSCEWDDTIDIYPRHVMLSMWIKMAVIGQSFCMSKIIDCPSWIHEAFSWVDLCPYSGILLEFMCLEQTSNSNSPGLPFQLFTHVNMFRF